MNRVLIQVAYGSTAVHCSLPSRVEAMCKHGVWMPKCISPQTNVLADFFLSILATTVTGVVRSCFRQHARAHFPISLVLRLRAV